MPEMIEYASPSPKGPSQKPILSLPASSFLCSLFGVPSAWGTLLIYATVAGGFYDHKSSHGLRMGSPQDSFDFSGNNSARRAYPNIIRTYIEAVEEDAGTRSRGDAGKWCGGDTNCGWHRHSSIRLGSVGPGRRGCDGPCDARGPVARPGGHDGMGSDCIDYVYN